MFRIILYFAYNHRKNYKINVHTDLIYSKIDCHKRSLKNPPPLIVYNYAYYTVFIINKYNYIL